MTTPIDAVDIKVVAQFVKGNETKKEKAAQTIKKLLQHQTLTTFCKQAAETIRYKNYRHKIDKKKAIIWVAPIDRAIHDLDLRKFAAAFCTVYAIL